MLVDNLDHRVLKMWGHFGNSFFIFILFKVHLIHFEINL